MGWLKRILIFIVSFLIYHIGFGCNVFSVDENNVLQTPVWYPILGVLISLIITFVVSSFKKRNSTPTSTKELKNAHFAQGAEKESAQKLIDEARHQTVKINNSSTVFDFIDSYQKFRNVVKKLIYLNEKKHIYMYPTPRSELEKAESNIGATINDFISRAIGRIWATGAEWADEVDILLDEIESDRYLSKLLTSDNQARICQLRKRAECERNSCSLDHDVYDHAMTPSPPLIGERKHISDEKVNSLYEVAISIVVKENNATATILQRKLNISFSNATALISRMERDGIVGPLCGTAPRKILVSRNKMHTTYPSHQNDVSRIVEPKINIEQIIQEENEWRKQQRGLSPVEAELEQIDQMEGHQFEYWCADLLKKIGFINVEVTQGAGDQGVDILAVKDGIKYAIQCKCYSSDLGNKPIQEINTGKMIYHCQIGVVMTNRHFTAGGKEAAEATGVLLWDRDWIYTKLESISTQEGAHP